MIKRNGFKTIITILIVMVLLIISTLPVLAASHVIEVNILDGYIVQIKNPTKQEYEVTVKILYQDKNGNTIYEEEVKKRVEPFDTITIDAKDYYNTEKSQKVLAEITKEYNLKKEKETFSILMIILIALIFIYFIIGSGDNNEIFIYTGILLTILVVFAVISWQEEIGL